MATKGTTQRMPVNVGGNLTDQVSGGSTDEMLSEIQTGVATRVEAVARSGAIDDKVKLSIELAEQVARVHTIGDEKTRKLAEEILNAQMSKLREAMPGEMKTLAELQKMLGDELAKLGGEYANLERFNDVEQAKIDRADNLLAEAKAKLAKAEDAWWFKQSRLANAKEAFATAELAVAQAKEEAKVMQTKRILSADFSQIFELFNKRVEETLAVLKRGEGDIDKQYKAAQGAKTQAFAHKGVAAKAMESLQTDVAAAIAELQDEETKRDSMVVGTEDRTKVENTVSDMRKKVEELQGRLNQAVMVFQAKERATTQLEVDEQTLLGQLNVHKSLRASLKANQDAWKVTFDNRLAIMKAMAQSEGSRQINDVGVAMAQQNTESSAKVLIASMRLVTELGERHPDQLAKLMEVQAIQGQGIEQHMERMNRVLEATRKRAGATERHSYGGGGSERADSNE